MSDLTSNQLLAIELRKVADLLERIPLHAMASIQIHGVPPKARESLIDLFGGDQAFEQKVYGACSWHESEYLCGDMQLVLHHAREVAA